MPASPTYRESHPLFWSEGAVDIDRAGKTMAA